MNEGKCESWPVPISQVSKLFLVVLICSVGPLETEIGRLTLILEGREKTGLENLLS